MGGVVIALDGNTAFNTATALLARAPCFIVRFAHDATVQFSSADVLSPSRTTKERWVSVPSGIGSKVDFKTMSTTISGASFEITDVDGYVTNFIEDANTANTPMLNQGVTILYGYIDIAETSFLSWSGYIDSYSWTGTGWSFTCRDKQRVAKQKIFKSERTTLDGAINDSITTVVLTDGANFVEGDYIRVDDEVILLGATADNLTYTGCTRAQHSTTAAAHDDDAEVLERQVVTGHPLDILRSDVWETELGLTTADYDDDEIQDIEDHWLPSWSFTFYLEDPKGVEAKKWCEEQLFQPTGTFCKVRNDGTLSVGIVRVPFSGETSRTLTDTTLIDMSLSRLDRSMVNELQIFYDLNEITDEYRQKRLYIDSDSITNHGQTNSMELKFDGVREASNAQVIIQRTVDRIFRMLATSTPILSGGMSFTNILWEVGDVVEVTHSRLPDLETGAIGITSKQMVISSVGPNFLNGSVNISLRYTGLTKGTGTYVRIGSSAAIIGPTYCQIAPG